MRICLRLEPKFCYFITGSICIFCVTLFIKIVVQHPSTSVFAAAPGTGFLPSLRKTSETSATRTTNISVDERQKERRHATKSGRRENEDDMAVDRGRTTKRPDIADFSQDVAARHDKTGRSDTIVHLCFLVHGYTGLAKDLSYLEASVKRAARERLRRRRKRSSSVDQSTGTVLSNQNEFVHDIVVHNAVCNEHRTRDGIRNGGERLLGEILDVIRNTIKDKDNELRRAKRKSSANTDIRDVTISLVGNSLGGIYGRYAVAKFADLAGVEQEKVETTLGSTSDDDKGSSDKRLSVVGKCYVVDKKMRVHFNAFYTLSTPHLGVSGNTYLPLPRRAEVGIANIMGETGRDLFLLADVIKTMGTSRKYLEPLQDFRKRVAYANAYMTDNSVPTETAAFLCRRSRFPHLFVDSANDRSTGASALASNRLIVAVFETLNKKPMTEGLRQNDAESIGASNEETEENNRGPYVDDILQMSSRLDSLGWKKIFVDARSVIPIGSPIPRLWGSSSLSALTLLRKRKVVESRDIAETLSSPRRWLSLPLGHNMICAFSRDWISSMLYRGGRPLMDDLAGELVENMYSWNLSEENVLLE